MQYNFILGVGAQKAGTTWLFDYLKNSNQTNMGLIKEWHIWDGKHIDLFSDFKIKKENSEKNNFNKLRFLMQNNEGFYENYFLSLMSINTFITGDITPSYCGLYYKDFINIKRKLSNAGFNVKVIFLMRDPVLRCWSALRMIIKLNEKYTNISSQEANYLFLKYYKSPGFVIRTKYEYTVKNLLNAFDKKQIFFGIYENLFNNDNLKSLSNFLGIKQSLNYKKKYTNVSPSFTLNTEKAKICREFYNETYDFCFREFPDTKALWNNNE